MAIKGKKRPRSRGKAKRPAAAPRKAIEPVRRRPPWYRSPLNLGLAVIFGLVAVGIIVWLVLSARERAAELEDRQAVLSSYTESIGDILEQARGPASEMGDVVNVPAGDELRTLGRDAERWVTELQEVQTNLVQAFPEPEVEEVHQLFNEGLSLFVTSANGFQVLPDAKGSVQERVFTQAASTRDTAAALFISAIGVLDQLREDAELGRSGLQPPLNLGAAPAPTGGDQGASEEIEIPVEGDGDGAGNDTGDGDGG